MQSIQQRAKTFLSSHVHEECKNLIACLKERVEERNANPEMTNPPAACGLSPKSTIDKSATTKSAQDDANRDETPK